MTEQNFAFGPYVLFPTQRLLVKADTRIRLGSRALDILIALTARAGELVSTEDLVAAVWPNSTIEQSGLRVHISALRKVLADNDGPDRYIINVPSRGYRFIAPVEHIPGGSQAMGFKAASPEVRSVKLAARMIGREEAVDILQRKLKEHRLVTIVGPGGMGKTIVARALMKTSDARDGVALVDLATLANAADLVGAVASAFNIKAEAANLLQCLIEHVGDKQMLLVLDNCEHLVAAVADLSEALLHGTHALTILTTSRESLRTRAESVYRLPALAVPNLSAGFSASDALTFPSMQLFAEQARANLDRFELFDHDVAAAVDLIRKLDGIPLAIELAAASVEAFGLRGLADEIDKRIAVLSRGRRTAVARHQTLRASLDWSFDTLADDEKSVFLRLAMLHDPFTLDVVVRAVNDAAVDVAGCISQLVAKSLVVADTSRDAVVYRLLQTTRAYGRERLRESDDGSATEPDGASWRLDEPA